MRRGRDGGRIQAVRRALVALLAATAVALTGCTSVEGSGSKGYVSGDGQVVEYAVDQRAEPSEVSGGTVSGGEASTTDFRGQPLVVPVWGSWCGPCHAEAPILAEVAREYADRVGFLGVAVREESGRVRAQQFEEEYDLPYESIYSEDGSQLLDFDPVPRGVPAIMVLDGQGRVASLIVGELPSKGTLTAMIDAVLDGTGGTGSTGGATTSEAARG